MEGTEEKMKGKKMIYFFITAFVGICGFFIGFKYAKLTADSGSEQISSLNEEMLIVNDQDKTIGTLPKGVVLYRIPDLWGDENFYKVYFRVYNKDLSAIKKIEKPLNLKKFQRIEFILRERSSTVR